MFPKVRGRERIRFKVILLLTYSRVSLISRIPKLPLSFFAQSRPDYESSSSAFLPERCRGVVTPADSGIVTFNLDSIVKPVEGNFYNLRVRMGDGVTTGFKDAPSPLFSASSRFKKNAPFTSDLQVLSFPSTSPVFTLSRVNSTTISTSISFLCFNRRQNYKKYCNNSHFHLLTPLFATSVIFTICGCIKFCGQK